jgi:hypothetical protein
MISCEKEISTQGEGKDNEKKEKEFWRARVRKEG